MDTLEQFISNLNKCASEAATFPEDVILISNGDQVLSDFSMDSLDMSILFVLLDDIYPVPEEEWVKNEIYREKDTRIKDIHTFVTSYLGNR